MRKVLLDTSVYGRLVEDFELVEKIGKLVPNEYVIYGMKDPSFKKYNDFKIEIARRFSRYGI